MQALCVEWGLFEVCPPASVICAELVMSSFRAKIYIKTDLHCVADLS